MRRIFPMTETAKNATKTKTTSGNAYPTQWPVDGDKSEGYEVYAVDANLLGFKFIGLKSLYAVKFFISQVNETGTSDFAKHCTVGSFAFLDSLPDTPQGFEAWMADGNVSKRADGTYCTQDAQYRNSLPDMAALKAYYIKEFTNQ